MSSEKDTTEIPDAPAPREPREPQAADTTEIPDAPAPREPRAADTGEIPDAPAPREPRAADAGEIPDAPAPGEPRAADAGEIPEAPAPLEPRAADAGKVEEGAAEEAATSESEGEILLEDAEPPVETEPVVVPADDLVVAREEAAKYLSLAQRTQADFENFRKRAAREAAAAADRGTSRLAKELLPALDHLELALQASAQDPAAAELTKGVRLVQDELAKALGRAGIQAYSPQGERFDPEQHEAMAQLPTEGAATGTVVEVYQQGYRLNGSVLRPARVVVAA